MLPVSIADQRHGVLDRLRRHSGRWIRHGVLLDIVGIAADPLVRLRGFGRNLYRSLIRVRSVVEVVRAQRFPQCRSRAAVPSTRRAPRAGGTSPCRAESPAPAAICESGTDRRRSAGTRPRDGSAATTRSRPADVAVRARPAARGSTAGQGVDADLRPPPPDAVERQVADHRIEKRLELGGAARSRENGRTGRQRSPAGRRGRRRGCPCGARPARRPSRGGGDRASRNASASPRLARSTSSRSLGSATAPSARSANARIHDFPLRPTYPCRCSWSAAMTAAMSTCVSSTSRIGSRALGEAIGHGLDGVAGGVEPRRHLVPGERRRHRRARLRPHARTAPRWSCRSRSGDSRRRPCRRGRGAAGRSSRSSGSSPATMRAMHLGERRGLVVVERRAERDQDVQAVLARTS